MPLPETDDAARLALVKEAVRQGELRLAAQAQARQTLEVRAAATTAFMTTLAITLTAGRFTLSALDKAGQLPKSFNYEASVWSVTVMAGFATLALIFSIASLGVAHSARATAPWRLAGDNPRWLFDGAPRSEEQALLTLTARYATDIDANEAALTRMWRVCWLAVATFVLGIACSYLVGWYLELNGAGF